MASTIAGRIRLPMFQSPPTVTGAMPSLTPKVSCMTKPTTKIGIDISRRDSRSIEESKTPLRRRPAIVPITTPITASMASAMTARVTVTGNVWRIRSMTGWPEKVLPKSRVTAPFRKYSHWMSSGSSRWY